MKFVITEEQYKLLTEISKSKKLSKYVQFSTALQWYEDNKEKIASILGVDVNDLASEEDIIKQSEGLIINVINPQSGGRRQGGNITGFESFVKLEKNILHDLLHNLFEVHEKEFKKSLSELEFDESEIVEEIEILGIEESFMKYMGMRYPNPDFINQNINQLVSYLLPTIIQNDPDRIEGILDGTVEPYLEVNGKNYPTKGTPFEGVFEEILKMFPKDIYDEDSDPVENFEEFKDSLKDIIIVGEGITDSNGDRANFPDGGYYGDIEPDDAEVPADVRVRIEREYITHSYSLLDNDVYAEQLFEIRKESTIEEYLDEVGKTSEEKLTKKQKGVLETKLEELKSEIESEVEDIDEDYRFGDSIIVDNNDMETVSYDDALDEFDVYYRDELYEMGYLEYEPSIDASDFEGFSVGQLIDRIKEDDNSFAIFRRYFRFNTVTTNITNKKQRTNTSSKYSLSREKDYPSISKYLMTDNAKKLYFLLSNFRGYVIKNQDKIKQDYLRFEKEASRIHKELVKGDEGSSWTHNSLELKDVHEKTLTVVMSLKEGYNSLIKDLYQAIKESEVVRFNGFTERGNDAIDKLSRLYNSLYKLKIYDGFEINLKNFKNLIDKIGEDANLRKYFKNFVTKMEYYDSNHNLKRISVDNLIEVMKDDTDYKNLIIKTSKYLSYAKTLIDLVQRVEKDIYSISSNYENYTIIAKIEELLEGDKYKKLSDVAAKQFIKDIQKKISTFNLKAENFRFNRDKMNVLLLNLLNRDKRDDIKIARINAKSVLPFDIFVNYTVNMKPALYAKMQAGRVNSEN